MCDYKGLLTVYFGTTFYILQNHAYEKVLDNQGLFNFHKTQFNNLPWLHSTTKLKQQAQPLSDKIL